MRSSNWWQLMECGLQFMDERNLCAFSSNLRALIAQQVLEPTALKYGDDLTRKDASVLLAELRPVVNARSCGSRRYVLPRMKMSIGSDNKPMTNKHDDSTFPVTYLPMDVAINFNSPPLYGNERFLIQDMEPDEIDFDPIPFFVSHQWDSPDNPNHNDEFDKLLMFVSFTIQASIQACIMLLRNGFPLEQVIVRQGDKMRDAYRLHTMFIFWDDNLDAEFLDENGMLCKLPQVSGALVRDLFKAVANVVLEMWDGITPVTEVKYEWHRAVQRQIWFWYDYCSLPQPELRENDPQLQIVFDQTLQHLPELQRRCHSVAMNSSLGYAGQAWCVSEFVGMDSNFFGIRTEYGHPLTRYERTNQIDPVPFRVFELLVDPTVPLEHVLENAGLAFTNVKHNASNVLPICWILWNSILRRKKLFYDYFYSFEGYQPRLLVGIGRPSHLVNWLECTSLALENENSFETDASQRKPFLQAIQSSDDILDYDINQWSRAPLRSCDPNPDGVYQDLVIPCIDKENDHDPNATRDSIKAALATIRCALQASKNETYYRVYIEQQDKKNKVRPHFSLSFYDLERY